MTLLTICQDAISEVGLFEVPTSIVGSNNQTAKRLLALANREGRLLTREHNWQVLLKSHTFTTADGTASYDLPSDFDRFADETWWDRTNYWEIFGPASEADWQTLKSGIVTDGVRRWFRLQGDQFYIHPTPTSADTIAYDYYSNQWCESSGGTGQTEFEADADVAKLDEDLITLGVRWRFLKVNGLDYTEESPAYQKHLDLLRARDGGAGNLHMGRSNWFARHLMISNIPESGFGS